MSFISSRRLFTWWHWLAVPMCIGAFVMAFATHLYLGLAWSVLFTIWFWDSGETTCSRCSSYNTLGCGVQGKIIPWFWKKKSMASASPVRIHLHFYFDIVMLILMNAIYALEPIWLPLTLTWTFGAWLISFGPRRFHGLLFLLKKTPQATTYRRLVSLPMVVPPEYQSSTLAMTNKMPSTDDSTPSI